MSGRRRFVRKAGLTGVRYRAKLEPVEADLLIDLVRSVQMMLSDRLEAGEQDELAKLTGMATGPAEAPQHPSLARLLPNFLTSSGNSEDAERQREELERENAAMRMLHEPEIVEAKMVSGEHVLRTVPARGGTVSLTEDQASQWLAALNDVRLVLGEALIRNAHPEMDSDGADPSAYRGGVPEERPADDDPILPAWQAYYWTSALQDDLLEAMM